MQGVAVNQGTLSPWSRTRGKKADGGGRAAISDKHGISERSDMYLSTLKELHQNSTNEDAAVLLAEDETQRPCGGVSAEGLENARVAPVAPCLATVES